MPLNRPMIKLEAKKIIAETRPSPLTVSAIYIILTMIITMLCNRLMSSGITPSVANAYLHYFEAGNYDKMYELLERMVPSGTAVFINLLLSIVKQIIVAGFAIFCLNCVRRSAPSLGNLLDGFGFAFKIVLLSVLQYILIFLQLLLLVVPGLIAAYKYRQAIYILIDNPNLSVFECLRLSKEMMKGHKAELFVLDLSFIFWLFLSALPYVGYLVSIWLMPYMQITMALYYERLLTGERSFPNEQIIY